jgi:hypothetical protein
VLFRVGRSGSQPRPRASPLSAGSRGDSAASLLLLHGEGQDDAAGAEDLYCVASF